MCKVGMMNEKVRVVLVVVGDGHGRGSNLALSGSSHMGAVLLLFLTGKSKDFRHC